MLTRTPASSRPRGRRHRRSALTALVAVALAVTALAACQPDVEPPSWGPAARGSSVGLGPHVSLSWPAAAGTPTRYRIDVNGVTAAVPTGPATACVMVGLAPSTAYTFEITAYDAVGNWSGDLPTTIQQTGRKTLTLTTPAGMSGGPTLRCVAPTDTDADRLPDALETGTGSYAHTAATGTFATVADSDEDGIGDGDEVLRAANGLDLPGLGATPLRKDVLVEIDWASQITGCAADLRPTAAWITPLRDVFAAMPVSGPPGGPRVGIRLIVDHGQGGLLTGGTAIPDADGRLDGDPVGSSAYASHFTPQRVGYFHHAAISTEVNVAGVWGRQGVADRPGDSFKLGVGCGFYGAALIARLFMHELGHNLDLQHGGHEAANRKPNYGSVMNNRYLSAGADGNCDGRPDPNLLAYSDEVRGPIDENQIDEVAGFCPGVSADIDLDGAIDPAPYAFDVNGGGRSVLVGSDDFAHMDVAAFSDDDPQRVAQREQIAEAFP